MSDLSAALSVIEGASSAKQPHLDWFTAQKATAHALYIVAKAYHHGVPRLEHRDKSMDGSGQWQQPEKFLPCRASRTTF